jgi:transcriptional regulator GlxA family with amidase domain
MVGAVVPAHGDAPAVKGRGTGGRRVGTNHTRLGREFQTHPGMSTVEYLREKRLVRAQELLASTDRQIQQIAEVIGFRRASDFATAFRRRFGMTPREYRRRHG